MAIFTETVTRGIGTNDAAARILRVSRTGSETFRTLDPVGRSTRIDMPAPEGIGIEPVDAPQWYFQQFLADMVRVPVSLEVLGARMSYRPTLVGLVRFSVNDQKLLVARSAVASDTVGLDPAAAAKWYKAAVIADALRVTELSDMVWIYRPVVNELVRVRDSLTFAVLITLAETVGIAPTHVVQRAIAVLEALRLSDVVVSPLLFGRTLAEQIRIAATLANFFGVDAADTVGFTEALSQIKRVMPSLADGVGVDDDVARQMIFKIVAPDTVELDAASAIKMLFAPALAEDVTISAAYVEPDGSITTWTINARTGAVTEYENYEFNSFARFGQMYIGADSEGIYELNGCNDEGSAIIARVRSGLAQLTGSRFTMLRDAYLGIRGNGSYVLRVTTGDGQSYDYSFDIDDSMKTTRVQLGKGMRARYIAFELISTGSDFDLESVEFIPLMSQRRV